MELVNIYSAMNELDAELLKSLLESEGIPAMISSETIGRHGGRVGIIPGVMGGQLYGNARVLVRPEHAEQAQQIVSEVRFESDVPAEVIYEDE